MAPVMDEAGHMRSDVVAAYLDRTLSEPDRLLVEAHMAHCHECRHEVLDVSRTLSARHRIWKYAAGVAAAAAAIGALMFTTPVLRHQERGPVLRGPSVGAEGANQLSISAETPPNGAELARSDLQFGWSPVSGAVWYRFVLTDDSGRELWKADLSDTGTSIPASVSLEPETDYYWYVDVLLSDGRSSSTGTRSFRITR